MTDLRAVQIDLENQARLNSRRRMLESIMSSGDNGTPGSNIVTRSFLKVQHEKMKTKIEEALKGVMTGNGTTKFPNSIKAIRDTGLDDDTLSYLVIQAIIGSLVAAVAGKLDKDQSSKPDHVGIQRAKLCRVIGEAIHDEWRVNEFKTLDNNSALIKRLELDFEKRGYPKSWRKRTIKLYTDAAFYEWEKWSLKGKHEVGLGMVHLFNLACPGLLIEQKDSRNVKSHVMVAPSPAFLEAIEQAIEAGWRTQFTFSPMVVQPKRWTRFNLFRGGYLTDAVKRYPLVKGTTRRDVDRFLQSDLAGVVSAVNAVQETPWRINRDMLQAVQWAYNEYGKGVGKLPPCDEEPMPPEPSNLEDPEVLKAYSLARREVHDRRRRQKGRRIQTAMMIDEANKFSEFERIYFPHNMDFRGRLYPLSASLSPQGVDYMKSILDFADGQPIENDDAASWLAVAIANAYGYDKVSLQERVDWVCDNEEMILSVASDYRTDHRWMHAGEPFMFLRGCLEWLGLKEQGFGFVSHMPVHLDATASGLQHFSAMLRSEQGLAVNLVPNLPRQDVYGDVAKKVIESLMAEGTTEAAQLLSLEINRKATKRQVMTVPYNAKFSSCLTYTRAWIDEVAAEKPLPWDKEQHNERVTLLAKHIWQAIGSTVTDAQGAMTWISQLCSEYLKGTRDDKDLTGRDQELTWVTPDGLPIGHWVPSIEKKRIDTVLNGRLRLSTFEKTPETDLRASALAVAPNFVHSLDATHCRMAVNALRDMYPSDCAVAVIHDSFGTHAARTRDFVEKCIRPTFVQMYTEHDVLQELADSAKSHVKDPLALIPPEKGLLDLNGVLDSEFFFS